MKTTLVDSIGQTYYCVQVLSLISGDKISNAIVKCRCLRKGCDTIFKRPLRVIKYGQTKSCGCLGAERLKKMKRWAFMTDLENRRNARKTLVQLASL
jgi:hypothetical protein